MKDEKYVFVQDVKEKKITARSARNKRTHNGKGGSVKFPSDFLTKKELQKMNGEVKAYRLNDPMTWEEFRAMPDDLKITYIKLIREKFSASDARIAEMFGTGKDGISRMLKKLGISGGKTRKRTNWDSDGWYAWVNGVQQQKTQTVVEPEPVEVAVKDLQPFAEPEEVHPIEVIAPAPEEKAIPCGGRLTFDCPANMALDVVANMLGSQKVHIIIQWDVTHEEGGVHG